MRLIAKIFMATGADWTQSQTDWTKARPGTLRDLWRRNRGCKSRFHTQRYVSPALSGSRISDSYRTAHRLRDRPATARAALRAERSRSCQGGARVRYRWVGTSAEESGDAASFRPTGTQAGSAARLGIPARWARNRTDSRPLSGSRPSEPIAGGLRL